MSAPANVDPAAGADVVEAQTLYSAVQRGRFTVAEVAAIDARVQYSALPWHVRIRTPAPPGWGGCPNDPPLTYR